MTTKIASYIEINKDALLHNVKTFKQLLSTSHADFGVVLKANAYGHGLTSVYAQIQAEVEAIYVISPSDAFTLRTWEKQNQISPKTVVVIGAISADEMQLCAAQQIDFVVSSFDHLKILKSLPPSQQISQLHIFIDSGLGREGFLLDEVDALGKDLSNLPSHFNIKGVLSHFSNTEDVTEQNYAEHQMKIFEQGAQKLETALNKTLQKHFAASAATVVLPRAHFSTVRVGIGLYGIWPSSETRLSAKVLHPSQPPVLQPVLSWKCPSQALKTLPAGSFIGYGCTYKCAVNTRIAVFPVGYFDGYPRLLSGKAFVLVQGIRCPVLGRVMMNHIVADISHVPLQPHENHVVATLLGKDGNESISVENIASWSESIGYEVVARLGSHLQRVVVDSHGRAQ